MIRAGILRQVGVIYALLDPKTRRGLVYVLSAMGVLGILESVSLGLLLPLFQVIIDPGAMERYASLIGISPGDVGAGMPAGLGILVAVIVGAFVLKNVVQLSVIHAMNIFIYRKQAEFLDRLFAAYLAKDYSFHIARNSAVSLRNLTISAVAVFANGLMPILNLAMEAITVAGIGVVLVLVEPRVTIVVGATLGLCGAVVHFLIAPRAGRWGAEVNAISAEMLQWISESLSSIKAMKVAGREAFFSVHFADIAKRKSTNETYLSTLTHLPRLAVESIVMVLLGGVVVVLANGEGGLANSLPLLGLYAVAAMRLMPSVNRILNQMAQIRAGAAAIEGVRADMADVMKPRGFASEIQSAPRFERSIEFDKVSFIHPNASVPALDNVSFRINRGETVALVGPSGAGKSTLVDILIGLITPTSGDIVIDGAKTHAIPAGWGGRVGYVPQHIFLVDDTLRSNIAFGIPAGDVPPNRLETAIDLANLKPVIEQLANGVDTRLGENGSRLSGGQRQRVGIARAIFAAPDLLILDEATSALDLETERSIVDAVDRLRAQVTTVIVAHHLSTIRNCDRLILLDQGRVVAMGSYSELLQNNEAFQRLAELSQIERGEHA